MSHVLNIMISTLPFAVILLLTAAISVAVTVGIGYYNPTLTATGLFGHAMLTIAAIIIFATAAFDRVRLRY